MRQHGRGILGTKTDQIHHVRRQAVSGYAVGIIGISHEDKARLQPAREPIGIESRNVRAHAGVDDHETNS